jgi:hypothetical protein
MKTRARSASAITRFLITDRPVDAYPEATFTNFLRM